MRALYLIIPILCILAIAYRYYSAFIAAKIMALDDSRVTPAHTQVRRAQLLPDEPLGAVRPPFRGDRRRGSAHRAGAGGAVRIRARAASGWSAASAWPAPSTTSSSLWASTRRGGRSLAEMARTGDRPGRRRLTAAIAILFIIIIALAGLGLAVVNALAESAWGDVHHRRDDPARALHGLPHVRSGARGRSRKRRSSASSLMLLARRPRAAARRLVASAQDFRALAERDARRPGRLWVRRVGAAGLDAADATRLSQHVHEDRHDRACSSSASSSSTPS